MREKIEGRIKRISDIREELILRNQTDVILKKFNEGKIAEIDEELRWLESLLEIVTNDEEDMK